MGTSMIKQFFLTCVGLGILLLQALVFFLFLAGLFYMAVLVVALSGGQP